MAGSTKKGAPSSADQPPTGKKQLALRIEALAAASARLESRSDGLRRDLSRVDQAQSELATTAARLVGELDALARRSAGLEQNLREVSEANGELSRQIAQGPVSHPEVDRRLQEMEAGLEALAGRQGEVGPGLADLERRLASFEAAYSGLGEQAEALRARVEGLVSSGDVLQSVDASLGEIRAELDHLIRRLAAMEAADAQDTALLALEDRLGALERGLEDLAALGQVQESQGGELAGLGKRLESLGQAIHETTELIGQEAGKLAEVQARMQGDARTLEDLGAAQADDRDMLHGLTTRLDAQDAERGRDAEAGRAALESVQRQLRLLDEGLHRLEERGSGLGGRLDRVGDDVTGTAQRVERLSARLDALGGLADRVAELAQRTGPDELPPRLARLESALQGLDARLDQAEQDLGGERERGERDGARLQSLVGLAERVEDLRAATAPLEQRLQGQARALAGLEPIPDRVRQMEDLFQPLDARVCAQEHGLVGLQQRLGGVDRGLEELARHVDAGAERAAQQEERFNALAAEVRQNGVDLSSLVTRLDALGVPVHSLERELQETARRVQALGEGREHLAGSLAAIQDELNQLGSAGNCAASARWFRGCAPVAAYWPGAASWARSSWWRCRWPATGSPAIA
jgi:chromosome segregation ATPase